MAQLVDTSILCRLATTSDVLHATALRAVAELHQRGELLCITPQVLVEFRRVATRPKINNGIGLNSTVTVAKALGFEATFPLLEDTPDIFPRWKALVEGLGIVGALVHDARLVAVCHAHGVTHVLTFNTKDFARLSGFGPGIIVVDPSSV